MKPFWNTPSGRQNPAKRVSKDWILRLASILLAVVLWFYVGGEDTVEKNVMVPIEIINLPRDLVISNQFKKEIEVTVSGPRSLLLDLANRGVTRQVDLSEAVPGTMVIENSNQHIPVPRGITVQRVQPSSIILSLDKLIQKAFPVTAKTSGFVEEGYYLKSLKTDPDVITITGPSTVLSPLDELYTQVIDLLGVKQSAQLQVPLELDPTVVDLIGETSVTANLIVGLETLTKTMTGVRVHVVIDGVLRKVMPEVVKVTANIPKLLLKKETDLKKLLTVTAMQTDGEGMLKVKVIPRPDIELPIEIISIIPGNVLLVNDGEPVSGYPLSTTLLEEVAAVAMPDMGNIEVDQRDEEKAGLRVDESSDSPLVIRASNRKKIKPAE